MQMHMPHFLPAVLTDPEQEFVALFSDFQILGDFLGRENNFSHQWDVVFRNISDAGNVLLGNHQNMNRRDRVKIAKSKDIFVFIYDFGGNLFSCNLTKYTIHVFTFTNYFFSRFFTSSTIFTASTTSCVPLAISFTITVPSIASFWPSIRVNSTLNRSA